MNGIPSVVDINNIPARMTWAIVNGSKVDVELEAYICATSHAMRAASIGRKFVVGAETLEVADNCQHIIHASNYGEAAPCAVCGTVPVMIVKTWGELGPVPVESYSSIEVDEWEEAAGRLGIPGARTYSFHSWLCSLVCLPCTARRVFRGGRKSIGSGFFGWADTFDMALAQWNFRGTK